MINCQLVIDMSMHINNVNRPNYQNILNQVASLIIFLCAKLQILHLDESSHLLSMVSKLSDILEIISFFYTCTIKYKSCYKTVMAELA